MLLPPITQGNQHARLAAPGASLQHAEGEGLRAAQQVRVPQPGCARIRSLFCCLEKAGSACLLHGRPAVCWAASREGCAGRWLSLLLALMGANLQHPGLGHTAQGCGAVRVGLEDNVKTIRGLEPFSYEERSRELALFTVQNRKLQGHRIVPYGTLGEVINNRETDFLPRWIHDWQQQLHASVNTRSLGPISAIFSSCGVHRDGECQRYFRSEPFCLEDRISCLQWEFRIFCAEHSKTV